MSSPSGRKAAPSLLSMLPMVKIDTRSVGLQSGLQWNRWAFAGTLLYQDSDGFTYPDPEYGSRTQRGNTDYQRFNFNAKAYFNPTNTSEILFNGGIYLSNYGMPPGLDIRQAPLLEIQELGPLHAERRRLCSAGRKIDGPLSGLLREL